MKISLKEIKGFTVETTDGTKGKVRDFLFDEDDWIIRYIEADFGSFFKEKRILLPLNVLADHKWDSKHFPLSISKEEIDKSPVPEDKPTVSREYEKELMKHYGFPAYWSPGFIPPVHTGLYYPVRPIKVPAKDVTEEKVNEREVDTRLRSFNEVNGYYILASDGNLGHLEDLIADDEDWQLIYLIVDTSNWRPWSKKVVLLINWLDEISYESREVSVNVHSDFIKDAPEFDTSKPVDQSFEEALLDYYKRKFP
jgi:hypothetical protein